MFKKIIIAVILISSLMFAQEEESFMLSGNLLTDFNLSKQYVELNSGDIETSIVKQKKSAFLAGVLSAAVPGAGEIYTGNYLKGAIFLAVEAAAIYLAVDYDKQGDDKTKVYQSFALENWDPAKYARNSIDNFNLDPADYADLFTNSEMTEINYDRWDLIHKIEGDVSKQDIGKYYSHELASFKDQQYFEMIGKYQQFNNGWKDFNYDENSGFDYHTTLTKNFEDYSVMRGDANDNYNKSSTFVTVMVINHVLSVVDAAISAKWYNDKLKMNAEVKKENIGFSYVYYPKLKLRYSL
ncbi:MAG: hypothetical protein JEY94_13200 [Melioribacteraceae bacterium]|nr:hypothetical protein [Melioribacteraceae bacterium]